MQPAYPTAVFPQRSISLLTMCLLLAAAACSERTKPEATPPEAGFVVMTPQPVALEIQLPGRTAAYQVSEVRPQVSGIIEARQFTEGAIVREGQTLYRIDASLYRAAAAEAQAGLANAEANHVAAVARADRYRPLAKIEAVSKQDYTDAEATAKQAAAAVAQSRAQLDTARINLRFTRVPAPITGRIGRSLVTTGAPVTAGQATPLTTIQRLDPIFVDIQQSSAELLALRRSLATNGVVPSATTVRLQLEDGSEYGRSGRLQFTEPVVDQNTGTVTLRATFANPDGLLLPGMFVRAHLSQMTVQNAMLVPQRGVSRDPRGNATVMLIGPDNKVVPRDITAQRTVGDKWLVTQGLKPGDRVIVEGLGKVRANQPVYPVPAGSSKTAPARAGKADQR